MTAKTHMIGGFAAGLVAVKVTGNVAMAPIFLPSSTLGALWNDIDEPKSKIGHKVPILSWIIKFLCGHRGLFHAPLFYAVPFLIYIALLPMLFTGDSLIMSMKGVLTIAICGVFCGIMSHLILDSLTIEGIPWRYPFTKKHYSLLKIETGSWVEFIFAIALLIACGYLLCDIFPSAATIRDLLKGVFVCFK